MESAAMIGEGGGGGGVGRMEEMLSSLFLFVVSGTEVIRMDYPDFHYSADISHFNIFNTCQSHIPPFVNYPERTMLTFHEKSLQKLPAA